MICIIIYYFLRNSAECCIIKNEDDAFFTLYVLALLQKYIEAYCIPSMNTDYSTCAGIQYLEQVIDELLDRTNLFQKAITISFGKYRSSDRIISNDYQRSFPLLSNTGSEVGVLVLTANHPDKEYCPDNSGINAYYMECCIVDALFDYLIQSAPTYDRFIDDFSFYSALDNKLSSIKAASDELMNYIFMQINSFWYTALGFSFDFIDQLSLSKYEKAESNGRIIVVDCASSVSRPYVNLGQQIPVISDNTRLIRKLMTGAGKMGSLLICPNYEKGQAYCFGITKSVREEDTRIEIKGPYNWRFIYEGNVLFCRSHNNYSVCLDNPIINAKKLIDAIKSELYISLPYAKKLADSICKMTSDHGASVLVIDKTKASELTTRLNTLKEDSKALGVDLGKYSDWYNDADGIDLFSSLASMDGAMVIDQFGVVLYAAAILDGESCIIGNTSRGARYNSIKNFVAEFGKKNIPIIGVVMSEDGGQNILCGKQLKS